MNDLCALLRYDYDMVISQMKSCYERQFSCNTKWDNDMIIQRVIFLWTLLRYDDSQRLKDIASDIHQFVSWDEDSNANGHVEHSRHISWFLNYVSSIGILASGYT